MEEFENKNSVSPGEEQEPEILVTRPSPAPQAVSPEEKTVRKVTGAPRAARAVRRMPSPAKEAQPASHAEKAPVQSAPAEKPRDAVNQESAVEQAPTKKSADTILLKNLFSAKKKEDEAVREEKKPARRRAPKPVHVSAVQTPAESPAREQAETSAEEKKPKKQDRGGVLISLLKALLYIAFVLVVSGFLAVFGIRFVNDIFAFVKDEMTVEVTVPEGSGLDEVADLLCNEGLIENADWFRFYAKFKYDDRPLEFVPGTYTLNTTMNYDTFISTLLPKKGRVIVSVLIPEGFTVDQIIDLLVEKGIGTREGYVDAIQNYDYNYEFLDVLESIEKKDGRKYRLEGYLFPAKYDLYQDSGEIAVIDRMLSAFQDNFTEVYNDRLIELGMNMDEVVTLASIIQHEAQFSSDMYYISGVFHNRLNNSASYPYLGSDATVQYVLPEHKEELTAADLDTDSPYNTHKYKGLPPGAICNPGLEAISAALYPEDKLMETRGVKSYYFVAGIDGYSIYGANQQEHLNNIAKVKADKEAAAE